MTPPDTNSAKDRRDAMVGTSDMPAEAPILRLVPGWAVPYMRLARFDRLIGAWILVFPCWWSLVLASPGLIDGARLVELALAFAAGAVVMRGAGCVINDIIDRDVDARVARTAARPVASGAISVPRALIFLTLLLLTGLAIVSLFNLFTMALAISSLVLVVIYPFMKRVTYWPQAWLGLTMTFGALLGWAAVRGSLDWPAGLIYAGAFFWTLGYDTIYAYADRADDIKAGIKTLSLKLGDRPKPWFTLFYTVAAALFGAAGYTAHLGWLFWPILGVVYVHMLWQAWAVDLEDPDDCLAKFRAVRTFGWLLLLAILAGQAYYAP
jgi:4-hydroxybenzoate polyprenyltransferase